MGLPTGSELLFILGLALIVFGPKRLPEIGRTIGQGLRELRKASREITDAFDFREPFESLSSAFDAPASDTTRDDGARDAIDDGGDTDDFSDFTESDDLNLAEDTENDMQKENDQNADDSVGRKPDGVGDYSPDNSPAVRDQEAAGDRQVDG